MGGRRRGADGGERLPTTVLFTDIVDSTARAAEMGDERWRQVLRSHHATIRRELKRHGGREIDNAGDGFFAAFAGPAAAIRCACAIVDAIKPLGIEVRAGIHVGEAITVGDKPGGVGVHIGSRIAGLAGPSEVLVSGTVRDLTEGSGIPFEDRGVHALKGISGDWRLFTVSRVGDLAPRELAPEAAPRDAPRRRPAALWVGLGAAAAVIAALVWVLAARRDDPGAPPASPQASYEPPVTLARVEPDGITPLRTEQFLGQVALSGDVLWVTSSLGGDNVERWDAARDKFVSTIPLSPIISAFRPPSVAVGDGALWVLLFPQFGAGELVQLDPTSHAVERTVRFEFSPNAALAAGGGAAWVAAADGRVLRVDSRTGRVTVPFEIEGGAVTSLAWSAGALYGVEPDRGVFRYRPGSAGPRFRDVDEPVAIAVAGDSAWVTSAKEGTGGDPDAGSLIHLDATTLAQRTVLPVPDRPFAVAATDAQVWVGCLTGWLAGFDTEEEEALAEHIRLPSSLRSISLAAGDAGVFVALVGRRF